MVVEIPGVPTRAGVPLAISLEVVAPWLQDVNHVRQVGVLAVGEDPNQSDPFERVVHGSTRT